MIQITATAHRGQDATRTILSSINPEDVGGEWVTEPSSVPLVILCGYPWTPNSPHGIPGRATLTMGKRLAATLAIELNTLEMNGRVNRAWHVVVLDRDGGFSVCRIMVNNWTPSSPFDLPPDAGDFVAPNIAVRSCARSFNRRQMDRQKATKSITPGFWCLPVKKITPDDVLTLAVEGGAS
jgi:hypothetical protein